MLENEGYEVMDAANGEEGLKLIRDQSADLIITDLIMPQKEGLETIRGLKRDFPNVKIIAISGGGRIGPEEYLNLARKLGANYTFAKPVEHKELIKAVKNLMTVE
jgi:YesN/AraC family two-component response regulator